MDSIDRPRPLFKLPAAGRECFDLVVRDFQGRGAWDDIYVIPLTRMASEWDHLVRIRGDIQAARNAQHRRVLWDSLVMTYRGFAGLAESFRYGPKPEHWLTWFTEHNRPPVEALAQCLGLAE